MNLPEPSGWTAYDPKAIGEYLGSLIESVIAEHRDEKNAVIAERDERIEKLERMLDEAYARVEDLLPKMDGEGSLMKEEF